MWYSSHVVFFVAIGTRMVRVLVACEESQVVTIAFRALGIEAYSCDIEPCSGGYPEWHYEEDVAPLLTCKWSLVIAFPPCTDLASSGARYFKQKRKDGRQQRSIDFFMQFTKLKKYAIENPIGIMSNLYRKPDQIIQPWQYGHGETKATCLWLRGLPRLEPTKIVQGRLNCIAMMPGYKDRSRRRSKTYTGIAEAMAVQWSKYL
jgi:hypothetical protein